MKANVLIVDESQEVLDLLQTILARAGYGVRATSRSDDALALLRSSETFQVLLTDIVVGPLDGFELIRRAKTLRPGLQSIVLTGRMNVTWEAEAVHAGVFAYLAKPPKISRLVGAVEAAVAISAMVGRVRRDHPSASGTLPQARPGTAWPAYRALA